MNDLDKIASTVTSNLGALDIIASQLASGAFQDENTVLTAFNSVMAAQQNAETCYNALVASVDTVPYMIAASEDSGVYANLITASQQLKSNADILLNVMANEFGIEEDEDLEDNGEDPEYDDAETLEDDEDDGEEFEDDEDSQVTASELKRFSTNNVTASDNGQNFQLFDFINN